MIPRILLIAAGVSALLHAYVGWRLLPSLGIPYWGVFASGFWLFASALLSPAPLLIRLRNLPERAAELLAWIGYLSMGLFSSLLVLTILRDVGLTGLAVWNALSTSVLDPERVRYLSSIAVLITSAAISVIGLLNARRVAAVVRVDLPIAGLPRALEGFRIVQLSDLHVGPTIQRGYLEAIVERVNSLDADVVALTGDLADGPVSRCGEHTAPLATLRSRHGSFCVTGNHEYYHGVEGWLGVWHRLGLRVLNNESAVLEHNGERVLVGGVTDFSGHRFDEAHRSNPAAAAHTDVAVAIKLLLAHQPRSAVAAAEAGFDVQLSGHTHGGQFWPWIFFVRLQQPYVAGLARLKQLWVYTSRGTGYWGPPLRFGAPSEITLLRLVCG